MATPANPNSLNGPATSINKYLQSSKTTKTLDDGSTGTVNVRNYQHASRIFVDGNYRLSPKMGYLFYVEFDFNPQISNVSNLTAQELGMIVKSVSLPKFTIDTKIHNAYNRKNIVQNKINYDPVNITFHDDQADNVRSFWYDYYSFFYRDSDYADATYGIISKYQERPSFEWGYTPRPVASYNSQNAYQQYQYINAIRIYSLYQKNFSEYELINPIITSFKHGDHDNGSQEFMNHQMSISYETVKYQTGYTTTNTAGGFIDLHYDNTPSPIAPAAGVDIVSDGRGGYTAAPQTVTDLADYNLTTSGGSVVAYPNTGALNASTSFATVAAGLLDSASTALTNAGGFALPALGSLLGGLGPGVLAAGQLGSAQGLLSMATAAIQNPKAALATVENMAKNGVMSAVTQSINGLSAGGGAVVAAGLTGGLATAASGLESGLASGVKSLSTAIGDAYNKVSDEINSLTATQATFKPDGSVDASNLAGWANSGG